MEKNTSNKKSDRIKGILHIILAAFGFAMMSFFVRLSGDLPTMEKAFFRNFVAVFVLGDQPYGDCGCKYPEQTVSFRGNNYEYLCDR